MTRDGSPQGASAVQGEYLIRIYTTVREGSRVVGSRLAERLGVSASAVTQALQRMERQGLAVIDQSVGVQLTPEGRKIAESIIRRHYLIERLLVDSLGYDWADADDEAEHMEHTLSSKLEDHLYESLGHPTTCPHGNPFPGSADEQRLLGARKMTDTSVGETIVVWRITEEGEDDNELLHFVHDHGMTPNNEMVVEEVDLKGGHLKLNVAGDPVTIPTRWAQHIRVSGPVS
ncbi:MAG: metal-dependent transcriptional regulator [Dehalococcoidia bacterium]|nr:metal-dependent transcriptional regulator [Dehalococcoidia bacterium]